MIRKLSLLLLLLTTSQFALADKAFDEALDNVTPADVFFGRHHEILSQRQVIKLETLKKRRAENLRYGSTENRVLRCKSLT